MIKSNGSPFSTVRTTVLYGVRQGGKVAGKASRVLYLSCARQKLTCFCIFYHVRRFLPQLPRRKNQRTEQQQQQLQQQNADEIKKKTRDYKELEAISGQQRI
jgi:hypothetical protein